METQHSEEVVLGGIYQHYKGQKYRLINVVRHSETLEEMIMYEALYENEMARFWVRPSLMFLDYLPDGTPRFKYLGTSDSSL